LYRYFLIKRFLAYLSLRPEVGLKMTELFFGGVDSHINMEKGDWKYKDG